MTADISIHEVRKFQGGVSLCQTTALAVDVFGRRSYLTTDF